MIAMELDFTSGWPLAVVVVAGAMLFAAGLLTLRRVVAGPTVLNRTLATDVLISIMLCALGLEATMTRHDTTLPILISLSLVGFVGSVSVARFVARDADDGAAGHLDMKKGHIRAEQQRHHDPDDDLAHPTDIDRSP